jgi:hypothetical protein
MDCFTDDINKIFDTLQESNDFIFKSFFRDMNEVNKAINNGKFSITFIDTDSSICYRTDDNDDTIWHVLIRNFNKDISLYEGMCFEYLKESDELNLVKAITKIKNKNGKTAVQEAIKKENTEDLLEYISYYFKDRGLNCDKFADYISTANDISIDKAKQLIRACY